MDKTMYVWLFNVNVSSLGGEMWRKDERQTPAWPVFESNTPGEVCEPQINDANDFSRLSTEKLDICRLPNIIIRWD